MKGWVAVCEPSPFRRNETHVEGPFRFLARAWWFAFWYTVEHPFSEVRIVRARSRVTLGGAVLWDG